MYRYNVPATSEGEDWATVILTSDGLFSVVSDFGNYCYHWHSFGDGDFRQFFVNLQPNYVLCKLANGSGLQPQYDGAATLLAWKRLVLEMRRARDIDHITAREMWDASIIANDLIDEDDFRQFIDDNNFCIDDIHHIAEFNFHDTDLGRFCEKVLPNIQQHIKGTLCSM